MPKRFGSDSFLGAGKETAWGTNAARTFFFELLSEGGGLDPGRKELPTWRQHTPVGYFDVGAKDLKSVGVPLVPGGSQILLRSFFGSYVYTLNAGVSNQHDFRLDTAKPLSLSLEVGNTEPSGNNASVQINGCYGKKLTFDFPADDIAKLSMDFIGLPEILVAKTAIGALSPYDRWVKPGYTIVLDADTGVSLELDNLTISLDTGLDNGRTKLKPTTSIVEPEWTGKAHVTGSFSRDYSAGSMYAKLVSGAVASLKITWTGPAIPALSGLYTVEILLNKIVIKGSSPAHSSAGIVTEKIDFEAQDDTTGAPANTAMKVKLLNEGGTL